MKLFMGNTYATSLYCVI